MCKFVMYLGIIASFIIALSPYQSAEAQSENPSTQTTYPKVCGCFHTTFSGVYPTTFDTCDGKNIFLPGILSSDRSSAEIEDGTCFQFTNLNVGRIDERGGFGILGFDSQTPISSCDWCSLDSAATNLSTKLEASSCFEVSELSLPHSVENFGIIGNKLAIAGYYETYLIDIAMPEKPALMGTIDVVGEAVSAKQNTLYIVGSSGISIIDISDPRSPKKLENSLNIHTAFDVETSNNWLFVADWDRGLIVFDITNPASPVEVGNTGGWHIDNFDIEGDVLAAIDNLRNLVLYDISDPARPALKGSTPLPEAARGWVQIFGHRAFVASSDARRVQVFDISEPSSPVEIGTYNNYSHILIDTSPSTNRMLVTDPQEGVVFEIDISDPTLPKEKDQIRIENAVHVVPSGQNAFVLSWDGNLHVLRCPGLELELVQVETTPPIDCNSPLSDVRNTLKDNLHTLSTPIRLHGEDYEVHLVGGSPNTEVKANTFANAANGWTQRGGYTGLFVTTQGQIVTDPELVRDVLLTLNAAYYLYEYRSQKRLSEDEPQYQRLPYLDEEYAIVLNGIGGIILGALSPGSRLKSPSLVLRDTFRQILQSPVLTNGLTARLREATVDDAKPIEEIVATTADVVSNQLTSEAARSLFEQELLTVANEISRVKPYINAAKVISVIAQMLLVLDMEESRAELLHEYMEAFDQGSGALTDEQAEAAGQVLAETHDKLLYRLDRTTEVMLEFVVDWLEGQTVEVGSEVASALVAKYGISTLGTIAATLPIALRVNAVLYGTDEMIADFRIGEQAEALRKVFEKGKDEVMRQAEETVGEPMVYDGTLASHFRSAYLLEIAASALSARSFGNGYLSLYRRPNFNMIADVLMGGVYKDTATEMIELADIVEQDAIKTLIEPVFLDEAMQLAQVTCIPAVSDRQAPSTGISLNTAAASDVPRKYVVPDLEAYSMLMLGADKSSPIGILGENRFVAYDPITEKEIFRIEDDDPIFDTAWDANDGGLFAACSKRGELTLRSIRSGEVVRKFAQDPASNVGEGPGCSVAFADSGRTLLSTSYGSISAWDVASGKKVGYYSSLDMSHIRGIAISAFGDDILVGGSSSNVSIRSLPSMGSVVELPVNEATAIAFLGNDDFVAIGSLDETTIWSRRSLSKVQSFASVGGPLPIAISDDQMKLAIAVRPDRIEIWSFNNVWYTQRITDTNVDAITFSLDGSELYVADNLNNEIRSWQVDALQEATPVRPEVVQLSVLVDKLNVRSGPSTDEKILAQVNTGDTLQILNVSEDQNWLMVCCVDQSPGWVSNNPNFIKITPVDGIRSLRSPNMP